MPLSQSCESGHGNALLTFSLSLEIASVTHCSLTIERVHRRCIHQCLSFRWSLIFSRETHGAPVLLKRRFAYDESKSHDQFSFSPRELAFLCRFAPLYLHKTLATREVETRKSEWHTLMKGYITRRKNVPASSHGRREDSIHCYEEWCRSIDCILPTSQLINKMKSAIIQLEEAMNTPFIPLSRGII